jgi:hypothetical protein
VTAALALALAALSRSHLLLLVGVGALLVPPRAWLPLALVPALAGAALWLTRDPAADATAWLGATRRYSALGSLVPNAAAWAAHWTLALPFALPWAALRGRALARQPVLWLVLLVALSVALRAPEGARYVWQAAAIALGAGAVADVLWDAWRRRDRVQLALGAWLLVPLAAAPYVHLPAKYLLAAAPAAAILVARAAAPAPLRGRAVVGLAALAGVALGVAILRADAALAGLGRRAAEQWIAPRVAAGQDVWFAGHWGFQWYAERAGARPLTVAPPHPRAGDLLVSSARAWGGAVELVPGRQRIDLLQDAGPGGRIMSFALGAGFYSNYFGLLPWAWGDDPSDRLELWEIR